MATPENNQLQDDRPDIRPVLNAHIQRKLGRAKLGQWILTGLSLTSGVGAVVAHELDAEAGVIAGLSAPVAMGIGGGLLQVGTRRQTRRMAEDYIASLEAARAEALGVAQPEPARADVITKGDSPQAPFPDDELALVASIGSAVGAAAGPFLSMVLSETLEGAPPIFSPGPVTAGGFALATGLAGHYASIRSLSIHQNELMSRMDAAEASGQSELN